MLSEDEPAPLSSFAHCKNWVGWRPETRDGLTTKVPYDPRTGRRAKADDPSTWATHDEALQWATSHGGPGAGAGIVLSQIGNLLVCGVDLDSCRDKATGKLAPWAQEVIDRFKTYTEISPSGTGVKLFFTIRAADLPAVEALFDGKFGRAFKNGNGEHPPAIEIHRGHRYFAVTWESCGETDDLRRVSLADLEWLIRDHGPKFAGGNPKPKDQPSDDSRSAKAFRAGAALKAAGASYQEIRTALLGHDDPEIAEWARTKGMDNGERELHRIYDKALADGVINPGAPYDIARLFQRGLPTPLHHHRGSFFEWSGCAWPETEEAKLRARLYAFLDQRQCKSKTGRLVPVKPTAPMVGLVLDALRAAAHLDATIEPPTWLNGANGPPAHELIACANGLLHLPTRTLAPHTRAYFNHNALDFAYDPGAPKPRQWLEFLHQAWPEDPESIATLQQAFGYLLTNDTSQQKAFLVVGPRRSGKGTIARVLARLIGLHNYAAPTLASLSERFGLAPLIDKSLAIISDARLSGRADQQIIVERLLSITGEDGQTIDRKFNPRPWTGKLPTRFTILTNELPKLGDASGALAGRFILLMLTVSFYGREDLGLTDKLLTELPGILNWALTGWEALKRGGYFRQPASARQAMEQLEDLASPIAAFVRERCETGPACTVGVEALFDAWKTWCAAQGRTHPGTKQGFGRDLRAALPELKITQPREEEGRVRAYQGLRLKPTEEQWGWTA
jgi:putative DNA primase/helicase